MEPAGTWRLKPRSASTPSYCFRRSVVSMTIGSATLISCPAQPCQLRLEQPPDLLVGDVARAQFLHGARDDRLCRAKLVRHLFRPRVPGHERAGAMAELDDPFVL